MDDPTLADAFLRALELRGVSYSCDGRLVEDWGFDSQDLLGLVLELEMSLNRELDDGMLLLFARGTLGEICAGLAGPAAPEESR